MWIGKSPCQKQKKDGSYIKQEKKSKREDVVHRHSQAFCYFPVWELTAT